VTSTADTASVQETLHAAAFGAAVEQWPLPVADTATGLWLRAVAAGGQGRYASAHADLAILRRRRTSGPLASLAHSTTGSLLRQLGWHGRARRWDGVAFRLADNLTDDNLTDDSLTDEDLAPARADALVGLAADALGLGRFALSAALLERARGLPSGPPRQPVRLAWVSAELAMASGDGAEAVRRARCAVELAAAAGVSARHRVKSDVVLAAALCAGGDLDRSRIVADTALTATEELGLVPLRWALASLLDGIGSTARSAGDIRAIRDQAADLVRRRGGRFAGSPDMARDFGDAPDRLEAAKRQ
jgi:hypothetical protein